ncbi:hypothetical protein JCM1841_005980 [Sporobolomyces salmonicolor]
MPDVSVSSSLPYPSLPSPLRSILGRTNDLVLTPPYSSRVTTTSSHPQLRDLLCFTPSPSPTQSDNSVTVVCYDSLASHCLYSSRPPEYTPLQFSPSCLTYGLGLVAAGGQNSEVAIKGAGVASDWCHQLIPYASPSSSPQNPYHHRRAPSGSINNSIHICPSPSNPDRPRLLVSSNDESIKVYDVAGHIPDWRGAQRRRERARTGGWSTVEASWAVERGHRWGDDDDEEGGSSDAESVEEQPTYDEGGACTLVPVPEEEVQLRTAVNHCSVSPDGKRMVAVGDTNEVFLYNVKHGGGYERVHVMEASEDASFSTDWSQDGMTFAVASQDGFVHVYDIRHLSSTGPSPAGSPSAFTRSSRAPKTLATFQTTQRGPAGAARKVKFSPGGRRSIDSGLMAFTEHRNRLHIVDARTFTTVQILDVPLDPLSASNSSDPPPPGFLSFFPSASFPPPPTNLSPPLRPRPYPAPSTRTRRSRPNVSRFSSTTSTSGSGTRTSTTGSGARTPRDEREREALEREMRERVERRERLREEGLVTRDWRRTMPPLPRDEDTDEDGEEEDDDGEGMDLEEEGEERPDYGSGAVESITGQDPSNAEESDEDCEDDGDEDDAASAASSVNTTRPRRFGPEADVRPLPPSPQRHWSPARSSLTANAPSPFRPSSTSLAPPAPASSSAPPARRNFSGYAPLTPNPVPTPPVALPTSRPSSHPTPASYPSYSYSPFPASSSRPSAAPTASLPFSSLFAAPLSAAGPGAGVYHSTSTNFPVDSSPLDLLGVDWDEWGERVLVATAERVWEWDVDARARRGCAAWGYR